MPGKERSSTAAGYGLAHPSPCATFPDLFISLSHSAPFLQPSAHCRDAGKGSFWMKRVTLEQVSTAYLGPKGRHAPHPKEKHRLPAQPEHWRLQVTHVNTGAVLGPMAVPMPHISIAHGGIEYEGWTSTSLKHSVCLGKVVSHPAPTPHPSSIRSHPKRKRSNVHG